MGFFDYFNKNKKEDLEKGLEPTKNSFFNKITKAVAGKSKIDIESLDDIEEALIMSDVSLDTTIKIINRLEARIEKDRVQRLKDLEIKVGSIAEEISTIKSLLETMSPLPSIITLVVPKKIVVPARYKSRNLFVALPKSYVMFAVGNK
jgi:signal recognition particle GTPase